MIKIFVPVSSVSVAMAGHFCVNLYKRGLDVMLISEYVSMIVPPDKEAMEAAVARLDGLAKPPGSLGELEYIAVKLAGISGRLCYDTAKRCVVIMSSDNGVVEEGVASAPQSVTHMQTLSFARGIAGVSVLAKQFAADLIVVDVGINADIGQQYPMIRDSKIRKSTYNIAKGPAMTYDEAELAITIGLKTAVDAANDGYKLIGVGEMGIGNTTTSAAVLCALTGIPIESAAGKGAGLDDAAYGRKLEVIREALEINRPDPADIIDVLAKVGGFDIAAMVGVFIGGAAKRVPVVVDGFISTVAALAASRINPLVKEYMLASHSSNEHGAPHASLALGLTPCLRLGMRLGEGSGCPLMFAIIDAACAVMRDMGTFEQVGIGEEYVEKVRKDEDFHIRRL